MGKKNRNNQKQQNNKHQNNVNSHKITKLMPDKKNKKNKGEENGVKMSNLFQIVPENDDFAALGYEN